MKNTRADLETETIRSEANRLFRETEAIYTFAKLITMDVKLRLTKIKECLDTWDKAPLQKFIHEAKREIEQLRNHYGIKVPNQELVEIVDWAKSKNGNPLPLLPKYTLREIFDHYELVSPDFAELLEHTDIVIHFGAECGPGKTAFFLLEAILYEDMASLFN